MNVLEKENGNFKIEISEEELCGLANALNEVCNGIDHFEFHSRMGVSEAFINNLVDQIQAALKH